MLGTQEKRAKLKAALEAEKEATLKAENEAKAYSYNIKLHEEQAARDAVFYAITSLSKGMKSQKKETEEAKTPTSEDKDKDDVDLGGFVLIDEVNGKIQEVNELHFKDKTEKKKNSWWWWY